MELSQFDNEASRAHFVQSMQAHLANPEMYRAGVKGAVESVRSVFSRDKELT